MFTICLPSYVFSQCLTGEQDESARYKSWIHKYDIDTHSISSFIKPLRNHWLTLQCDWLSAVRFILEKHYILL